MNCNRQFNWPQCQPIEAFFTLQEAADPSELPLTPCTLDHLPNNPLPTLHCSLGSVSRPKNTLSRRKKHEWSDEESGRMLQIHDELGNRWIAISKLFPGKSENDIKNHFFSQLRMALRALNRHHGSLTPKRKRQPQIKPAVLYKLISNCQQHYIKHSQDSQALINLSLKIKRALFNFLTLGDSQRPEQALRIYHLIKHSGASKRSSKSEEVGPNDPVDHSESECIPEPSAQAFDSSEEKELSISCQVTTKVPMVEEVEMKMKKDEEVRCAVEQESCELIAKPNFCLLDPFEQASLEMDKDENFCFELIGRVEEQASCLSMYFGACELNPYDQL